MMNFPTPLLVPLLFSDAEEGAADTVTVGKRTVFIFTASGADSAVSSVALTVNALTFPFAPAGGVQTSVSPAWNAKGVAGAALPSSVKLPPPRDVTINEMASPSLSVGLAREKSCAKVI